VLPTALKKMKEKLMNGEKPLQQAYFFLTMP
jgi:hypothetical protein